MDTANFGNEDYHDEQNLDVNSQSTLNPIAIALQSLIGCDPSRVVEIRALGVEPLPEDQPSRSDVWSGTYHGHDLDHMARDIAMVDGRCKGVYVTLNPIKPTSFGYLPSTTVLRESRHGTHSDRHILHRDGLMIDVDPVRPDGFTNDPATDVEQSAAFAVVGHITNDLAARGWPTPAIVSTGNGYQITFRTVPIPTDSDLIQRTIKAIGTRHSTPLVHVDTTVGNASRIIRVPGTVNRKGTASQDRPHRRAELIQSGENRLVTQEQIEVEAATVPPETATSAIATSTRTAGEGTPPVRWLAPSAGGYTPLTTKMERRAVAILDTIPAAIQGQGGQGSRVTLWAARCMVRGFLFSPADAFRLLDQHFNPRCSPAWPAHELAHKITEAASKPFSKPDGWLLQERPRTPRKDPIAVGPKGYDDITPEEAALLAATTPATEVVEECALAAAKEILDILKPSGYCPTPIPLARKKVSTGIRCVSGYACKNARGCQYCRHYRAYEKGVASTEYIIRTSWQNYTDGKASDIVPRLLVVSSRTYNPSDPDCTKSDKALTRKLERLGAEYTSILTVDCIGCMELAGVETAPECVSSSAEGTMSDFPVKDKQVKENSDIVPQTAFWVVSLPPGTAIPTGFAKTTAAGAIRAIGNALATIPPPPQDCRSYKFFFPSHGWKGDEVEEDDRDAKVEGRVLFSMEETHEILTENKICRELHYGRSQGDSYKIDCEPAAAMAVSMLLRGAGRDKAQRKPSRNRVSELIGEWVSVVPREIGDGNNVAAVLLGCLWVTPLWEPEVIREQLRKADRRDKEEAAVARVAEPLMRATRHAYRGREHEFDNVLGLLL